MNKAEEKEIAPELVEFFTLLLEIDMRVNPESYKKK